MVHLISSLYEAVVAVSFTPKQLSDCSEVRFWNNTERDSWKNNTANILHSIIGGSSINYVHEVSQGPRNDGTENAASLHSQETYWQSLTSGHKQNSFNGLI